MKDSKEKELIPLEVFIRIKRLKKNPNKYLSSIFKRTPARISQAFAGRAPGLLSKINTHCELLENKT